MSILKWLGLTEPAAASTNDGDTVRRIIEELDNLPEDQARFVASFAFVLGRVAYADRDISTAERAVMERLVAEVGGLEGERAELAVTLAARGNELFGGTESFVATRAFAEIADRDDKERLLHCLFAVAAADDSISGDEERQIRQIASELGLSDRDYVQVRRAYNDKRELVRRMQAL